MAKSAATQTAMLEKLVENTSPKEDAPPSYDEYISDLTTKTAEELGLEPDDPAVKLTVRVASEQAKALSSWNRDDLEAQKKELQAQIEELKGGFVNDRAERVKSSDAYIANKEQIDEMVSAGIDEGKAIQFVLSKAATTSDTSAPPPSTPDGRVTGAKVQNTYWSNQEERQRFVQQYGEEATAEAEATGTARMKRSQEVV